VCDQRLFPTDGSDRTAWAAAQALGLARRADATLHALHVVEPVRSPSTRTAGG
jgi:nucleotide-binding universal stress UspA family protein